MDNHDLEVLFAKEAIRDQIYTYCRALDRIDNELGYTVFAEDSTVNYGPTFPSGTGRQFIDNMLNQHRHMISTHHMMTNILIKLNNDCTKAATETYMYAACKFPNKKTGSFTVEARCRDIDRWEKRDGKWLIVDRVVAGDNTFMIVPAKEFENYNTHRNNKKDHSYTVFGEIWAYDVVADFTDIQKGPQALDSEFLIKAPVKGYETGIPTAPGQFENEGEPELSMNYPGQDTVAEFRKIGYSDEQIKVLLDSGMAIQYDEKVFQPDRFNIMKPGTIYNQVFSVIGKKYFI